MFTKRSFLLLIVVLLTLVLTNILIITFISIQGKNIYDDIIISMNITIIITTTLFIIIASSSIAKKIAARQQLFRFFGITPDINLEKGIRIYVSRVEVKPGGSQGTEPITKGYVGPAIPLTEYDAAQIVRDIFQQQEITGLIHIFLTKIFGDKYLALAYIHPKIYPSPTLKDFKPNNPCDNPSNSDHSSNVVIIIGSSIYNTMSLYYLLKPKSRFYFSKKISEDGHTERILKARGKLHDREVYGRSQQQELAIIQRINDREHKTTVFICAGLGSDATRGSTRYLKDHWPKLLGDYEQSEFALCLGWSADQLNPDSEEDFKKPAQIIEAMPPMKPRQV